MFKILKEKFSKDLPEWLINAIKDLNKYDINKIAWDSCSFEEREIPKSMKTAKKDDTKLPVFLVNNGRKNVLVIPGIIENTVAYYRTGGRNSYERPVNSKNSVFKYWNIVHFGVLNVESMTDNKRASRERSMDGIKRRWTRTDKEADSYWGEERIDDFGNKDKFNPKYYKFDKSGYEITNPERYAKMLNDMHASSTVNKFVKSSKSAYKSLIDLRARLRNLFDNDDVTDDEIESVEDKFREAIGDYNYSLYYLKDLCEIEKEGNIGNNWRYEDKAKSFEEYINKVNDSIKELEKLFDKVED